MVRRIHNHVKLCKSSNNYSHCILSRFCVKYVASAITLRRFRKFKRHVYKIEGHHEKDNMKQTLKGTKILLLL